RAERAGLRGDGDGADAARGDDAGAAGLHVGGCEVDLAVAVEVGGGHSPGSLAYSVGRGSPERPVSVSEQDPRTRGVVDGVAEVALAVAVEVRGEDLGRAAPDPVL